MGTNYPGRITVVGTTVCIGLLLLAAGAWSSYSQAKVAHSIGMDGVLCAALPAATDLMVVTATIISLSPHFSSGVRVYAQWIAIGGGFFSFGIGALHSLLPPEIVAGWGWARFVVGGIPSLCMGLSIHLVAMIHARDRARQPVVPETVEDAQAIPVAAPIVEESAPDPMPASETRHDAGRPAWLKDGMNAKQAIFAYLEKRPEAKGPELDRVIQQHFSTKNGYGRKTKREWALATGWRSDQEAVGV
jgi:hypothetical protein